MLEDYKKFLDKIKKLESYLVNFNKDVIIKNKTYLSNCIIKKKNCWLIIMIIYNKNIFLTNNSICKA